MSPSGPSVLITDSDTGQNRSALAAVRALATAGYRPVVATCARHSLAASSRHCTDRVGVPPVRSERYAAELRAELARRAYLCVLPSSDATLLALDATGKFLVDKEQLAQRAAAVGMPFPPHRRFASGAELRTAASELTYPLAVKPAIRRATTQLNVTRVDRAAGLDQLEMSEEPVVVQPWIDASMRAVAGVAWRGSLVAAVHQRYLRTWPLQAGVASAALTVEPDLRLEEQVLALLDGFEGVFQAQLLGEYLIDLNPRVYGSLPLAVAAGANLPAIFCDLLAGRPRTLVRGRVGVRYRWIEGDVRHLVARLHTRRCRPSEVVSALRPRSSTVHSVTTIADPGPLLARLRHLVPNSGAPPKRHHEASGE